MTEMSRRSQAVRTRHKENSSQRTNRAAEYARNPVSTPPVISRKGMAGTPLHHKAGRKVRRKFYYALSTPGAEVRLPALPEFHPTWRLLSGGLVLLLVAILIAMWSAPTFRFAGFKLVGAKRVISRDIESVLRVANMPVFLADVREMEATLTEAFPDFSAISVHVGFPASMVVTVSERAPAIVWQQDGQIRWIDAQGYAFPARGDPAPEMVTVVAEGQPSTEKTGSEAGSQAGGAAPAAETAEAIAEPTSAGPFIPVELIQPIMEMTKVAPAGVPIAYHPRYGLGWSDPGGWKVYFGQRLTDMQVKLQEYQAIYDYVTANNIHPSLISVEFPHAPYYRLEP